MGCLVCFVLILLVKSLTLIDAGCQTKPNVTNTVVNAVDQCKDVTMKCVAGFKMEQYAYCREGKWKYQEPTCKADQCMSDPVILNGTLNIEIKSRDIGQQYDFTCQEPFTDIGTEGVVTCNANGEWEANITCKDCITILNNSYIDIGSYLIKDVLKSECNETCEEYQCGYIRHTTNNCQLYRQPVIFVDLNITTRVPCVQKCKELNGCITMSYDFEFDECVLLNATLEEILSGNIITGNAEIIQDTC